MVRQVMSSIRLYANAIVDWSERVPVAVKMDNGGLRAIAPSPRELSKAAVSVGAVWPATCCYREV